MLKVRRSTPTSQRGLSIIELMLGIAVGLFVVGGATKFFVDYMVNNRRAMLETRLNQDLRAAANQVVRDVRRAGFWRNSLTGVGAVAPALPASNPYRSFAVAASSLEYSYDRDGNAAVDVAESAGYRLSDSTIQTRNMATGQWQDLTDPSTAQVTRFEVTNAANATQWVDVAFYCPCIGRATCTEADILALPLDPVTGHPNRPQIGMTWLNLFIEGRAVHDARVVRRVELSVRGRNNQTRGTCPA